MAFKLVTVLCATFAFAHGGLLGAAYSPANEVSSVYSSIGSISAQPVIAQGYAQAAPVLAAPAIAKYGQVIAAPAQQVIAGPALALKSYASASPIYSAPIAKVAYSPANEVSSVYSSIAAPQYAYGAVAPQYAYGAAAPQYAIASPAIGSSQQSTIRSLGGTISTYSKAVDTAFSSVRKADTRISNNVFTPALATKTIAYQQPAIIEQKAIPAAVVSHVSFDGLGAHYAW